MNFPQAPLEGSVLSADVLNASVCDVFGEADVEAGETVAGCVDDDEHGVTADGVELQGDDIVKPGQQVLQQPLLPQLQSDPRGSTVTVTRGRGGLQRMC